MLKNLKNEIEKFLILLQFTTRIPVFIKTEYSDKKLGKGIKYFPIIGLIIGILLYLSAFLLVKISQKVNVISFLLIIIELLLVGLIHIDGLADSFDALFSYAKKEKMLEIMKDSRVGTNGAVILILYFISKLILLSEIIQVDARYLIIYPIISRLSTSINAGIGEYARKEGMSNGIIEENTEKDAIFSIILSYFLILGVFSIKRLGSFSINGIISLVIAIFFILFFRKVIYKKIDGITGDTMGASLELTGILVLLTGVILK